MSRLHTPLFIARRLSASADGESRGTMIRISIATTALCIAVMIVSLAVVAGFKREISSKVEGFVSRLQIVALTWEGSSGTPISRLPQLEAELAADPDVSRLNVFASRGGVIKTDAAVSGVVLKGVDEGYDMSFFERHLVEGTTPKVDSARRKDVMISASLAALLDVGVGDKAEFMIVESNTPPRRDRFRVCGIYNTGFGEMDRTHAITDLRNVQRLCGWDESEITGYELSARNEKAASDLEYRLYLATLEIEDTQTPLMVIDTHSKYPTIFDWLKAHDVNAAVIITIMFAVALLSALSALLIMLLERTQTIGILKALGMSDGGIQQIFIARSLFITLVGAVIGDILGVGLCLAQKHLHLIKLDSEGYFLSEVPISLSPLSVVLLDVGVIALLMAILTLPTLIISRIKPEKTIRFQ